MNFLLASFYFSVALLPLNLQAQILDFEGSILCRHKGGNGIITADFGAKSLNFENLLSRSEFDQAKNKIGYKLGELSPARSASSFQPVLQEAQSRDMELFAENIPFGGPLVKASASLILKDLDWLLKAPGGAVIRGELHVWLGEASVFRSNYENARLEPQFEFKAGFHKTFSCEISR